VPSVRAKDWARTPIDRFILARLEAEGLSPSREADPVTLLRRLSLDLVGLPQSTEESCGFPNIVRPLILGSRRPVGFACRLRADGRSIAVGANDFTAGLGAERHPGADVNGILDKPDAAVGHRHVHSARMPAIRVAEVRPPAGADATAVGE
jgi:hypothetical protein